MITLLVVLIACAVITAFGTAVFVLIVINIQIIDRSRRLMQEPHNFFDAATRRVLGATRHSSGLHQKKES